MLRAGSGIRGLARWSGVWDAYGRVAVPVGLALGVILGIRLAMMLTQAAASPGAIGIDFRTVTDAASRWMSGSDPYLARQLGGPYQLIGANLADSGEFLYPPVALPFLAVFDRLPAPAWWAVPLGLGAVALWRLRPARWSWPILGLLLASGHAVPLVIAGNPTMWVLVAALWTPLVAWPGALILLKPSVAPLALLGITRRSWWLALGMLVAASIPFGALWADWYRAITDLRENGAPALLHSLTHAETLVFPLVALAARSDRPVAQR
jgi:hypothetical protein